MASLLLGSFEYIWESAGPLPKFVKNIVEEQKYAGAAKSSGFKDGAGGAGAAGGWVAKKSNKGFH